MVERGRTAAWERVSVLREVARRGWDVPFLLLLGTLAVTAVFFAAMRHHDLLELSFDQLTELDSRLYTFHLPALDLTPTEFTNGQMAVQNVIFYIIDDLAGVAGGKPETLLQTLSVAEWETVSKDVDYVAFLYTPLSIAQRTGYMTEAWLATSFPHGANASQSQSAPMPLLTLFACGCVVPNALLTLSSPLDGAENAGGGAERGVRFGSPREYCVGLAGYVLDVAHVRWVPALNEDPLPQKRFAGGESKDQEFAADSCEAPRLAVLEQWTLSRAAADIAQARALLLHASD